MVEFIHQIKYKKLVPEAKSPIRIFDVDAGFDLFALTKTETPDFVEYGTGLAFEIPEGMVGLVFPRSSVTKYDFILKNSVGIIDASFRGEIKCRFYDTEKNLDYYRLEIDGFINKIYNPRNEKKHYKIGERICQIVFLELPKITLIEAEKLSDTERGSGGFGHTGK
jgi:dUTP pyrophosphatase